MWKPLQKSNTGWIMVCVCEPEGIPFDEYKFLFFWSCTLSFGVKNITNCTAVNSTMEIGMSTAAPMCGNETNITGVDPVIEFWE